MVKKQKLSLRDKAINKTLLLILTVVWGFVTVVALATNYIIGLACIVVLYILIRALIQANDIEHWIVYNVGNKKW